MNKALLIAINDYKGTENDLRGCINDQNNMIKFLTGYELTILKDSQCTVKNVIAKTEEIIASLKIGDKFIIHDSSHGTQIPDRNGDEADGYDEAIYLYDGVLVDDKFNELLNKIPVGVEVLILLDCCFSGTATRNTKSKSKFIKLFDVEPHVSKRKSIIKNPEMNWVVISGCSENQTSADAFINGRFEGAFTHYLLETWKKGMTIKEVFKALRNKLPNSRYTQIPTIEGKKELFNSIFI